MRISWVFLTVCVIGLVLGEDSVGNEGKTVWPENVDIDAEVNFEILRSEKNLAHLSCPTFNLEKWSLHRWVGSEKSLAT